MRERRAFISNRERLINAIQSGNVENVKIMLQRVHSVNFHSSDSGTPLGFAIQARNDEVVELLLKKAADVELFHKKSSPLCYAVEERLEGVVTLLLQAGAKPNVFSQNGWTPLAHAPLWGQEDILSLLLDLGADINASREAGPPIYCGLLHGSLKSVDYLLDRKARLDIEDQCGNVALHAAAESKDPAKVQRILQKVPEQLERRNHHNESPSYHAISSDGEALEVLLQAGADSNAVCGKEGESLLHRAAYRDFPSVIQKLVEYSADIGLRSIEEQTPLHFAAQGGGVNAAKKLADLSADLNARSQNKATPLHLAALNNQNEVVRWLCRINVSKDASWDGSSNRTCALHVAAEEDYVDIARTLLDNGVDVDQRAAGNGATPLWFACCRGSLNTTRLLLERGAAISANNDDDGSPPALAAAQSGSLEIADLLISRGADISSTNSSGEGATFIYLSHHESPEMSVVKALQSRSAPLEHRTVKNDTVCHIAAFRSLPDIVSWLLSNGCSTQDKTIYGSTPLHSAVMGESPGRINTIRVLLNKGADVNARNKWRITPLLCAASNDDSSSVNELIRGGASLDLEDENGDTPLVVASCKGCVSTVRCLLDHGASIHHTSYEGSTSLHFAAWNDHIEIVGLLLSKGAGVDTRMRDGSNKTALHLAAIQGHKRTVQLLLDNGADKTLKDRSNFTPSKLAKEKGHASVGKMLDDVARRKKPLLKWG